MNAINPAIGAARRPGLLGGLAVVLWIGAVCLGIVAPLAGIRVDTTLMLGALIASGVVSLLSLPMAAAMPRRGVARSRRDAAPPT
jgi:hypothetical protein